MDFVKGFQIFLFSLIIEKHVDAFSRIDYQNFLIQLEIFINRC